MELEAKIQIIEYPNGNVRRVLFVRQYMQPWQEVCDINSLPIEMVWIDDENTSNTKVP